jgi:protein-tyrosine phosphatase
MTDIHSHIIPSVDDGSQSMTESLEILERAEAIGIMAMAATPHIYEPDYTPAKHIEMQSKLDQLRSGAAKKGLKITLHLGYEIYLTETTHQFLQTHDFSYNQTGKYVLIEMPMNVVPPYLLDTIFKLQLAGITPIIAHPERNHECQRKIHLLNRAIDMGALMQLDADSILGGFGNQVRETAKAFVLSKAYHVAGSDVHNLTTRKVDLLAQAKQAVIDMTDCEGYADEIFVGNSLQVLKGQPVINRINTVAIKDASRMGNWLKKKFKI